MPRLHAPLQGLTAELNIQGGRLADPSPLISLDAADDLGARGGRHFFAIIEPVTPVPGAETVAIDLLESLRARLAQEATATLTADLLDAFEEANRWVHALNQDRPPQLRLEFGLTCAVARDDDLYIAQVPPSQVLIAQEGELYAFPGLDTWRWHRRDEATESNAEPLGRHASTEPDLYHTRIDRDDLIVLCSTSVAQVIEREPQDVFVSGDAEAVIDHLTFVARNYAVTDGAAAAVTVAGGAMARERPAAALLRRLGGLATHLVPEETVERFRRRHDPATDVDFEEKDVHTGDYPAGASDEDVHPGTPDKNMVGDWERRFLRANVGARETPAAPAPSREAYDDAAAYWGASFDDDVDDEEMLAADEPQGKGKLTELLAGAVLALSAAVVGVWQLTVHRDRPIDTPRDDGTLGLPRLQRYDDSPRMPDLTGLRRRLPRAPISRLTGLVAVVFVLFLAGALTYSVHQNRVSARESQVEESLQAAVQMRESASQATSPLAAQAHLAAAEARLAQAEAMGLDPERAGQERAAIAAARDKALNITRVSSIQMIGGVPAAPEGVTPRLFMGNGQLYILTDALYRFDATNTTLVRLLAPGDQVGGQPVGTLLGAAWGDGAPLAFDGSAAYLFDPTTASWSRQELGTFGSAYSGIVAANGFGGNLYMLSPGSGQILKFAAGSFANQPEDWTGGLASSDLQQAADFEIDGRIYVLLRDGRILDFYMGALEKTSSTTVTPPLTHALALSAQPDRPHVYVADDQGRILRLTRDGALVQQFMAGEGAPSLEGIRDIAIDDVLGSGYVLTDQGLLSIRLPAPPAGR